MAQAIAQKHMIEQYGPYGSQCPENYSFQLQEGESIKEVIVRHGFIVDAIGFVVAKPCGGTYTKMFGGTCGNESKIVLKCGEKITGISGTNGNYKYQHNQCVIATMKIHTNFCPTGYGPFGQGKGIECSAKEFKSPMPLDGPVVGVFGRHNNYLESVGIFVKKMDCPCTN
ncbi:protein GOS9-like isoform X2 [Chenopodium quinoa]|uniref:protein GOS9-like isoform X2 n=1 Tax=Chenopodium quinoa TaxID=63459 RepID=UPI000B76DA87|nr:protein GOS9-like isoform X2 [Chenopodium quinoa]